MSKATPAPMPGPSEPSRQKNSMRVRTVRDRKGKEVDVASSPRKPEPGIGPLGQERVPEVKVINDTLMLQAPLQPEIMVSIPKSTTSSMESPRTPLSPQGDLRGKPPKPAVPPKPRTLASKKHVTPSNQGENATEGGNKAERAQREPSSTSGAARPLQLASEAPKTTSTSSSAVAVKQQRSYDSLYDLPRDIQYTASSAVKDTTNYGAIPGRNSDSNTQAEAQTPTKSPPADAWLINFDEEDSTSTVQSPRSALADLGTGMSSSPPTSPDSTVNGTLSSAGYHMDLLSLLDEP